MNQNKEIPINTNPGNNNFNIFFGFENNINENINIINDDKMFDLNNITINNNIKQENKDIILLKENKNNNTNLLQINEEEEVEEEDEEKEENILEKDVKANYKCSSEDHKEDVDAIYYCQKCNIYMCNKCEKSHSNLFKRHPVLILDKNQTEIFTGLCTKPNHALVLEYYCMTHNVLCCDACLARIRKNGKGQHRDCNICSITKIKSNKKQNLEINMKNLGELSNKLNPSIKELKNIFNIMNDSKDKIKKEVQMIFSKLKTELDSREDKLYNEIDKKFDELFFKEEFIKESEKLPNLVQKLLEKGKIEEKDWADKNNLNKLINECINIENAIKKIDNIYDKVKTFNSNKEIEVEFNPKDEEIEKKLLKEIKNFGKVNISYKEKKQLSFGVKKKSLLYENKGIENKKKVIYNEKKNLINIPAKLDN